MDKIIVWINYIQPLSEIDLQIFSEYNLKTMSFLVGSERLFADKEFLIKQDKMLDTITLEFKEKIFDKCFEIIRKFSDKK